MASSLVLLTAQATALDDPLPCRRENPQLWFSDLPADLELAKAYCEPCPMRHVCLTGAVERREPHGVWGGEILARGAIIPEKRPRGRPPRRVGRSPSRATRCRSGHREVLVGDGEDNAERVGKHDSGDQRKRPPATSSGSG
jgi:WhiB family transcriptional regulator, redox-sensing transcriptional regulator